MPLTVLSSWTTLRAVLALSCLALWPPVSRADDLDTAARSEVVTALADLMAEHYVFADAGRRCGERLRADLAAGAFDGATDRPALAVQLTQALQAETADKHLRVRPWARPAPERDDASRAEHEQRAQLEAARENHGFEQVLRLPGNVGLLDLRHFASPGPAAAATAHAAMAFLAHSDALIVDLRQNGGGSPEMVQLLCSYLFAERTHLNSLWWRKEGTAQEFWTLDELPGARMSDVPVFVLTSGSTFSGAEEFAYNLRTRERATLIGETTGGGAHPGDEFPLPGEMAVFISVGRAINPVTGTNWEGTGVTPHVACPADEALDRALELATRAARERQDATDQPTSRADRAEG